jgi:hypothetical protein
MTPKEFQKLLREWCQSDFDGSEGWLELKHDVEFLAQELYNEYDVTQHGGHGNFAVRLARWIGSADVQEDQQSLYSILRHLVFLGDKELVAAYRTAYSKHVLSWLLKVGRVNVFAPNSRDLMNGLLSRTMLTQITDSFGLGRFLRTNLLQGQPVRYTWLEHERDWDRTNFTNTHLKLTEPNKRDLIVLFEDFVGSGSQMEDHVERACSIGGATRVLLCPLYICPTGAQMARDFVATYPHLTFSPVLEIPEEKLITETPRPAEHADFAKIRRTVKRVHPKIAEAGVAEQDFGPFGYGEVGPYGKSGSFVVMSSNCPDNTLPAIHRKRTGHWEPLFLRNSREGNQ